MLTCVNQVFFKLLLRFFVNNKECMKCKRLAPVMFDFIFSSFSRQIRVDGNNERSVQHSSGGRGGGGGPGLSSTQGGLSSSDGPSRHHHQRSIRERAMKKDKQDATPLVNGVS